MHKINLIFHFIKTQMFYKPRSIAMGKKVIICDPIFITPKHIKFGKNIFIRNFARIEGIDRYRKKSYHPVIEIHDGVSIEQNLHLTCAEHVVIKKNTAIAAGVTISDINHPYSDIYMPPEDQEIEVKKVFIGEDCKIYNNAVILPGTQLGKHCVVGANTVVSGKVYEDYCIIVGSPSKIIKRYSFEKQRWLKTDVNGNFMEE